MSALRRTFSGLLMCLSACVIEYTVPLDDSCGPTRMLCNGQCVDTASTPDHCGGCGRACALDQVCNLGACAGACSESLVTCTRSCVDLASHPEHCGRCDERCDADETCVAGDCEDACGDACDDERARCVSGVCQCREGFAVCDGVCVDLRTDASNCGACGNACDGNPCGGFACQPPDCSGFSARCGDSCTDLNADPLNCGECGRTCDADQSCIVGDCEEVQSEDGDG